MRGLPLSRRRRLLGGVVAALLTAGCERGCLATWLGERGIGGATPDGTGPRGPGTSSPFDLSGVDCSDGLLRCTEGRVEASRAAQLPSSCADPSRSTGKNPSEKGASCTCPWEPVATCPSGCVEDGLEIVGWPDAGWPQLCRPETDVARPLLAVEEQGVQICAREGYACEGGIVRLCTRPGQPVQLLAKCLYGCQPDVEVDPGETKNLNGVLAILCRRDHAERR
jgi:hypothetical protein